MTGVLLDPTLEPASLPGAPSPLGGHEAPVVRGGLPGPLPILLEGTRVSILGSERLGAQRMIIDARTVAGELTTDAGTAADVGVAPATLRRALVGATGTTLETILALPALPLAAVQWTAAGDGRPARALTVELTLLPEETEVRYHAGPSGVRASSDGGDHVVDASMHPAPDGWSVVPAPGGGVRIRARVAVEGPVTLVVAAGTPDTVARTMAAIPHLASHAIRAAASGDPDKLRTLVVRSGLVDVDHGVVWAGARVDAAACRAGTAPPEALFWSGIGALATGNVEAARLAIAGIARDEALGAFLAARYALSTGDQDPALERYGVLKPEVLERKRNAGKSAWGPWQDTLARLADALRDAVPAQELDGIRRFASQPPGGEAGKVIRLPMASGGAGTPPPANATWPGRLLGGTRGRVGAGAPPRHLAAWADLVRDRVDEGWSSWRGSIADSLAGGPAGRGSWDEAPEPWGPGAPGAGIILGMLAHGLLGIDPDEPSGRLGLAPTLPGHVTSFVADGIRMGDASVSLHYRRDGSTHHFSLEPLGGRVPVMAIFRPSVPGSSIGEVLVDGEPADLKQTQEGSRVRLEVQLPLDAVRTLDVTPV